MILNKANANKNMELNENLKSTQKKIDALKTETDTILKENTLKSRNLQNTLSQNVVLNGNIIKMKSQIDTTKMKIDDNYVKLANLKDTISNSQKKRIETLETSKYRIVKESLFTNKPIIGTH